MLTILSGLMVGLLAALVPVSQSQIWIVVRDRLDRSVEKPHFCVPKRDAGCTPVASTDQLEGGALRLSLDPESTTLRVEANGFDPYDVIDVNGESPASLGTRDSPRIVRLKAKGWIEANILTDAARGTGSAEFSLTPVVAGRPSPKSVDSKRVVAEKKTGTPLRFENLPAGSYQLAWKARLLHVVKRSSRFPPAPGATSGRSS